MRAQIMLEGRLYEATTSYRPAKTGGELVLRSYDAIAPREAGEYTLRIYLDGYYVNSTTAEFAGESTAGSLVTIEQLIALNYERVPDA